MSSELASPMLYIHPPLAVAGYAAIFLFSFLLFRTKSSAKTTQLLGVAAWMLTFLGLVTGMLWAQLAWGNYWSWDPKETMTLVFFIATSASMLAHFENQATAAKWLSVASCVLAVLTGSTTFILTGLHSFLH